MFFCNILSPRFIGKLQFRTPVAVLLLVTVCTSLFLSVSSSSSVCMSGPQSPVSPCFSVKLFPFFSFFLSPLAGHLCSHFFLMFLSLMISSALFSTYIYNFVLLNLSLPRYILPDLCDPFSSDVSIFLFLGSPFSILLVCFSVCLSVFLTLLQHSFPFSNCYYFLPPPTPPLTPLLILKQCSKSNLRRKNKREDKFPYTVHSQS